MTARLPALAAAALVAGSAFVARADTPPQAPAQPSAAAVDCKTLTDDRQRAACIKKRNADMRARAGMPAPKALPPRPAPAKKS